MTTAAPSTVLATIQPAFTDAVRVALAGFLAGYRGLTREAYALVVTIPLAPRTARAIDLAIGERTDGPVFLAADGRRLDRHGAGRIVRKVARRAGIGKAGGRPIRCGRRHYSVWLPGCRCAMCKRRRRTRIRGSRCGMPERAAAAWTGTRPTSLPPTSRAPPGSGIPARAARLVAAAAGRSRPHDEAITYGDPGTNANRRSVRRWLPRLRLAMTCRAGCSVWFP